MSARSHVDVNERRLRPIYDCLDNGNNKKALQEADKVLKKQKDFSCAKVLKGLALLRLGRHDESTALLQEVHALNPSDEATLQAMGIAYRELHKLELIADMYENAHTAKPDNEEVLSALFMAYVRLGNYKKQQQTAMKLHRLRPNKNPYYFWAIMSIVMQAHVDKRLAKTMFLPLAERMASKYVAESKIEAEAEVQMYLIILEQLERYEDALTLVQGTLGEKLISEPGYQVYKRAELLSKLQRLPQTNAVYRKMLIDNCDNWGYYKEYFRTLFALIDAGWTPDQDNSNEEPVDCCIEQAIAFLEEQVVRASQEDHKPRGPYLAQLELIRQLKERKSDHINKLSPPVDLIKQYYQMFGDKQCCFADLQLFINLLQPNQVAKIIEEFAQELGFNKDQGNLRCAEDVKTMQRHLCLLQMARSAGLHDILSVEDKHTLITELIQHYQSGLKFGQDLLSTDLQFCDNYILLAAHLLADIWQNTGDQKSLWRAIVILEKALKSSPSNFQFRLFLVQLYSILGACGPCKVLYDSMRIRNIQNDSLGYVICNHVGRLGHFSSAASIYGAMLRFFTINHKDTTEYLISSYKFGSFSKIHEFVEFRERLQNSLQYACATAERLLLDLTLETSSHQGVEQMLSYMEIDPKKDKTVWEDLRDNRDLTVMLTWDPASRLLSDDLIQHSFNEEVAWLKIRSLVLRCLAAAVLLSQQNQPNNKSGTIGNGDAELETMATTLENLKDELLLHVTEDCPQFKEPVNYPLAGPCPSRISSYLRHQYTSVLLDMLETVLYIHRLYDEGLGKADKSQEEKLKGTIERFSGLATNIKSQLIAPLEDKKQLQPQAMEDTVHTVELLGHVTILLGSCHKLLKPMKNSIAKKTKKKKENPPPLPETFTCFESVVRSLESKTQELKSMLNEVTIEKLATHLESLKIPTTDEEPDKLEQELMSQIEASYLQAIKEMSDLVQTKQTYLSSLRL